MDKIALRLGSTPLAPFATKIFDSYTGETDPYPGSEAYYAWSTLTTIGIFNITWSKVKNVPGIARSLMDGTIDFGAMVFDTDSTYLSECCQPTIPVLNDEIVFITRRVSTTQLNSYKFSSLFSVSLLVPCLFTDALFVLLGKLTWISPPAH